MIKEQRFNISHFRYILALSLFVVMPVGLSAAEWKDCIHKNPDQRIKGCTAYMSTSGLSGKAKASAYFNRAAAYMSKSQWDNAIKDYTNVLRYLRDVPSVYFSRGVAYARKHDYNNAIKDYDVAIKHKFKLDMSYTNRGAAYMGLSLDDLALIDYERARDINPDYAPLYHGMGFIYEHKGRRRDAINAYRRAIKLNPKDTESRRRLKNMGVTP